MRASVDAAMRAHNKFLKLFLHQGFMKPSSDRHGDSRAIFAENHPKRDSVPVAPPLTRV
jgi:hypothetical protein